MRLILPFLATVGVVSASAFDRRQLSSEQVVGSALKDIERKTLDLNSAVQAYTEGSNPQALTSASDNVLAAIKSAQASVSSATPLDVDAVIRIGTGVTGLNAAVKQVIDSLLAKKATIIAGDQAPTVYSSLVAQKAATQEFVSVINSKVPEEAQGIAASLSGEIIANLDRGVSGYQEFANSAVAPPPSGSDTISLGPIVSPDTPAPATGAPTNSAPADSLTLEPVVVPGTGAAPAAGSDSLTLSPSTGSAAAPASGSDSLTLSPSTGSAPVSGSDSLTLSGTSNSAPVPDTPAAGSGSAPSLSLPPVNAPASAAGSVDDEEPEGEDCDTAPPAHDVPAPADHTPAPVHPKPTHTKPAHTKPTHTKSMVQSSTHPSPARFTGAATKMGASVFAVAVAAAGLVM